MAGSHFHNGNLVLTVQPEQCERHSDVVVEVSFGAESAELSAEHGVDQLLGGGLAVRSSDSYDGNLEMHTVYPCQLLEGLQGIGNFYEAVVSTFGSPFDHGIGCTLLKGCSCKVVAVKIFTLQGKEH